MQGVGIFLAALAVFMVVVAIGLPFMMGDSRKARLASIDSKREAYQEEAKSSKTRVSSMRAADEETAAQRWVRKLNIARLFNLDRQRKKLMLAGWRDKNSLPKFMLATVGLPIAFGGYMALMTYAGPLSATLPGIKGHGAVLAVTLIGLFLPSILVTNAAQKRQKELARQFPDALDLLLVCVEAGLSVDMALLRVTKEIGESIPEVAEEFGLAGAELAYLGNRQRALENLTQRTGISEFSGFTTVVGQAFRFGTPVAKGLHQLVEGSRQARMNSVEKAAASLGPKMTVPMMIFILPTLFMIVLGPTVIRIMSMP